MLQYIAIALVLSAPSFASDAKYKATMTAANTLSIFGGLGFFAAALLDTVAENHNITSLSEPMAHVSGSSMISFAAGSLLSVVAGELNNPGLLERIDELASGMTTVGSVVIAAGIWAENLNAIKAGAILLSSFFVAKAHLVPLILQKNAEHLRRSDTVLIVALTALGNLGGSLLLWSIFEAVHSTGRHLLQAGLFILGVTIPVAVGALTVNLWRVRHS